MPRARSLAPVRCSARRAPFKPEANRLLGGGDAPPEFVEIEFKRGSAASFQSLPIFSHTTRYLPVTSRGVGPLVFEAEGPDLSRRGGPEWFGVERRDAGEITLVEESPQQRFTAGRLPRYLPSCSGQMQGLRRSSPLSLRSQAPPSLG
jgi:hypothetical protein